MDCEGVVLCLSQSFSTTLPAHATPSRNPLKWEDHLCQEPRSMFSTDLMGHMAPTTNTTRVCLLSVTGERRSPNMIATVANCSPLLSPSIQISPPLFPLSFEKCLPFVPDTLMKRPSDTGEFFGRPCFSLRDWPPKVRQRHLSPYACLPATFS